MTATPPEIGRLESARADAIVAGNLEALAAMVTNDYIHVDADGRVRDKAGYLEAVRSAAGRYTDYRLRDNHITVLDNMAWVHGSFENRFQAADGTIRNKSARHLRLYRLEAGGWRNCFHQGTLITAPE